MSYQKGIKINFISNEASIPMGATFDLSSYVTDLNALAQNTLIHTITQEGSDKLNPTRGTTLVKDSWAGTTYSVSGLIHIANFAALDTATYINDDILNSAPDSPINKSEIFGESGNDGLDGYASMNESLIKSFTLTPAFTINNGVIYNAKIVSSKDETIGTEAVVSVL